ncbi:long-chain-fatty-acid-CoA ligase [Ephemerocybe angulata]|uniref:Long-chain-fatty-acid-CoA ligase n=1 Tax=Ephemerocybe angulata TaxID=980116 RepID=A0A8H6IH96_9AGAR|nr:long-chain-fatty-acid-CoA ligase [Tulosesus angulatus]
MVATDKQHKWPAVLPYDKQAVPVPGTKRPGQSAKFDTGIWGLVDEHTPGSFVTLDQVWFEGLKNGGNADFLGWRKVISKSPLKFAPIYSWISYAEADKRRQYIGSALHTLFQQGKVGGGELETVGIWAQNRPEWQLVDLACQSYNKVSVSLYDTLGKDSVGTINHSNLSVVLTSADHVSTLLKLAPKIPSLKLIVSFDELPDQANTAFKEWAQTQGIQFQTLQECRSIKQLDIPHTDHCAVETFGKANLFPSIPATPNAVASICYTSLAAQNGLYGLDSFPDNGTLLSYLPLAHIYEVLDGLGYFTGDPLRLLEDAQILKPHFFPSVPRSMIGGKRPWKAVAVKLENLRTTGATYHPFWDRLVFRKIQAALGGQVKMIISGSAPLSSDIMDFLKIAFGGEVVEGYGLTETSATTTKSWPNDPSSSGTTGPPGPVNEVKVIDVPAMGYTAEDKPHPRGELCIRGGNVFTHYYKDEKNTKASIDDEGWFHTGDVAEIDAAGRVKIIDRVKNIMKLAQGEYVALERIENTSLCTGDGLQSYLVAVLVPNPDVFAGIVTSVTGRQVTPTDVAGLSAAAQDPKVVQHSLAILTKEAVRQGLKGFEMVKRLHISLSPFTVEENTLTPTFKLRRKDAYNKFKAEIDALYALGEPSSSRSTKL